MKRFRHGWILERGFRRWPALVGIYALTFASVGATLLTPWPMKLLIDRLEPGGSIRIAVLAAGATLALFALSSALEATLTWSWTAVGQRLVFDLGADMFRHLQRLSPIFHSRTPTGDSLTRLTGDSWCVYTFLQSLMFAPVQHAVMLLGIGLVAWQLDPVLTLVALSVAPIMAGAVVYFGPRLKRRAQLQRQTESQLVSFVHQTLSSIPLVQAFSTQGRNVAQFRELAGGAIALNQKAVALNSAYSMVTGLTASIGMAIVLALGAGRVSSGAMSLGGLVVFLAYLRTLQGAVQGLLTTHAAYKTQQASIERVEEVLHCQQRVTERPDAKPLLIPAGAKGIRVDLDNVGFGYEPARQVLFGIRLCIEPGEVVALVGATGAGKSTLTSLVPRLLDPWTGSVRLAEQDVRELTLTSVRGAVGFVPQESLLLPLSVEQNIAFGRPDATPGQIRAAADVAGATEFIERLPEGWRTVLGERGSSLSAGQRQRIAIARAVLKDAPVLILDEPTSNLDARTEHEVMTALNRLIEGRTCLIIAHRLSTARRAHRIVVLEHGAIVEEGTHDSLLARGGVYQRLWSSQQLDGGHRP